MSVSDLQLSSKVKAVLTRHWIDLRELRFAVYGGTVRLAGEARRLSASEKAAIDATAFDEIVQELRRLRDVKKVYFLDVKIERRDTQKQSGADPGVSVYRLEIDEEDDEHAGETT